MDLGDLTNREVSDGKPVSEEGFEAIAWTSLTINDMLGFFGNQKDERYNAFDGKYGKDDWLLAHSLDNVVIQKNDSFNVYEESYYHFFKENPAVRSRLIALAGDVYDFNVSNVGSGLDYTIQECDSVHLQDIAVRRALTRLKLEDGGTKYELNDLPTIPIFEGGELVQIRGPETKGGHLSPGEIPFHRPEIIRENGVSGWWKKGSVEDWYQKSKVLLVNPNNLRLALEMVSPTAMYFSNGSDFYGVDTSGAFPLNAVYLNIKDARRLYAIDSDNSKVIGSPERSFSDWRNSPPNISSWDKRTIRFEDL